MQHRAMWRRSRCRSIGSRRRSPKSLSAAARSTRTENTSKKREQANVILGLLDDVRINVETIEEQKTLVTKWLDGYTAGIEAPGGHGALWARCSTNASWPSAWNRESDRSA